MKTVFIKTVRSTGRSVHARGKLARIYEIGKRYTFNKEFPAHVGDDLESYSIENDSSLEAAYKCRPECNYGNRVLLCYGETKEKILTIYPTHINFWGVTPASDYSYQVYRRTSVDFEVIGEIFMPKDQIDVENPIDEVTINGIDKELERKATE